MAISHPPSSSLSSPGSSSGVPDAKSPDTKFKEGKPTNTKPKGTEHQLGIIAIGRNEGERLKACLNSLVSSEEGIARRLVYVDSGSSDQSVSFARSLGVDVVELDMAQAFTAARARNEGVARLLALWPEIDYLFFIDGDCRAEPDFIKRALDHFTSDQQLGLVTGHCREMYPEKTIYNLMCDLEWRGPLGEIEACGGIFMISRAVFEQVGGFNPAVIAAEDDELCIRVRGSGVKLMRIDKDMCWHDANILHFSQWWKRATRAGFAFGLVGDMHEGYFKKSRQRALLWGGILPLLILIGIPFTSGYSLLMTGLYGLSFAKTARGLVKRGINLKSALLYSGFLVLSKFASFIGMLKYWMKKQTGKSIEIVEYK